MEIWNESDFTLTLETSETKNKFIPLLNDKPLLSFADNLGEGQSLRYVPLRTSHYADFNLKKGPFNIVELEVIQSYTQPVKRFIDTSKPIQFDDQGSLGYFIQTTKPAIINIENLVQHYLENKNSQLLCDYVRVSKKEVVIMPKVVLSIFFNIYGHTIISQDPKNPTISEGRCTFGLLRITQQVSKEEKFLTWYPEGIISQWDPVHMINHNPAHLITILKADEPCPETIQEANFEKVSENLNWLTDILRGVILYLTEEEKVQASRVCKQWHRSIKKVNAEALDKLVSLLNKTSWRKVKSESKNLSFVIW